VSSKPINISLGTKFALMVLSVLVVTMSMVTFIYLKSQQELFLNNLKAKGNALGDFVSLISPEAILSYNFENMNGYMSEISKDEDVVYGILIASNGISLTNYLDAENAYISDAKKVVGEGNVQDIIAHINKHEDIVSIEFPVLFKGGLSGARDGELIATLVLGLSRSRIDNILNTILTNMLFANAVIIMFLSGLIYIGFKVMALRPILSLREGFSQVGDGNLISSVSVQSHDELGSLSQSFNEMVERLRETINEKDEFAGQLKIQADELRKLRDEALVANQHKSEFLANMSHELRTPLNAVIGFSQMLEKQVFGELNEKQMEYINDIHSSGRHLLSLINDILDLSKVEAGRMELQLERFHLPDAIMTASSLFKEKAATHGIELDVKVSDELGEILADERKVKQILLNLLSNAIKFTPDGGVISVVAAQKSKDVVISVTDTGPGISESDKSVIFEEFQQGSSGASKSKEGTGLGLALSKKFVELHGGSIHVNSELGRGSTFTFSLPNRHE
jgi:signal transduction histidine kinase